MASRGAERFASQWDAWPSPADGVPIERVEIYTDGAASQQGAGWGAVVLAVVNGAYQYLGCVWGPVELHSAALGFAGATAASAPAAELTGALAALKLMDRLTDSAAAVLKIDASHTVAVVNFTCRVVLQ